MGSAASKKNSAVGEPQPLLSVILAGDNGLGSRDDPEGDPLNRPDSDVTPRVFKVTRCDRPQSPPTNSLRRRLEQARAVEQQMRYRQQDMECAALCSSMNHNDNRIAMHMALNAAAMYQRRRLQRAVDETSSATTASSILAIRRSAVHILHNRIDAVHANLSNSSDREACSAALKEIWQIIGHSYSPTRSPICVHRG